MPRWIFWLVVVASVIWAVGVGWMAVDGWPSMSLDLAANDPATRAAYDAAVTRHLAWHGVIAIGPPVAVLVVLAVIAKAVRGR